MAFALGVDTNMDRKNKSEVGGISMARLLVGTFVAASLLTGCVTTDQWVKKEPEQTGQWPNDVIVRELGLLNDKLIRMNKEHKTFKEFNRVQLNTNKIQLEQNQFLMDMIRQINKKVDELFGKLNEMQPELV